MFNLNQKNSTLHLPEANDNISAQDRAANIMLLAWIPLITSFDGKNNNNNIKQSMNMLNGIENIKQQSTSTKKIQLCIFYKWMTTSMLKTEPQMPCSLHEHPWSPLSMPRMSILMPVWWVAIFDISQWIFGSVECGEHCWKALVGMHRLKWATL